MTQYRNKPIDSFLKVDETQLINDLTFEAVIGISVVAIVFLITCSSFLIYWFRRKRSPKSSKAELDNQRTDNSTLERATTPPINATGHKLSGAQLKMTDW